MAPPLEEENAIKRTISETSLDSISVRKTEITDSFNSPAAYSNWCKTLADTHLKARVELVDNHIAQLEECLKLLNENKNQMHFKDWKLEHDTIEGDLHHARIDRSIIHRHANGISGDLVDVLLSDNAQATSADAYIDALIRTYGMELMQTTTKWRPNIDLRRDQMADWKRKVRHFYNSENPATKSRNDLDDKERQFWCPISKIYWPEEDMRTTHIVPQSIGTVQADYLFGPSDTDGGHLYDVGNGIQIYKKLEEAMDRAEFIIVPANSDVTELKVVVIDPALYAKPAIPGLEYSQLFDSNFPDRQVLQFKHPTSRPRLLFLYFTCIMSIFRRRQYESRGWRSDLLKFADKAMWGSPSKGWIRGTTMAILAQRVGYTIDTDSYLKVDLVVWHAEKNASEDTLVADEVMVAYNSKEREHDAIEVADDEAPQNENWLLG